MCPSRAIITTATGLFTSVNWRSPVTAGKSFSSNFLPGDEFQPGVTKVVYNVQDNIICTFSVIVEGK